MVKQSWLDVVHTSSARKNRRMIELNEEADSEKGAVWTDSLDTVFFGVEIVVLHKSNKFIQARNRR